MLSFIVFPTAPLIIILRHCAGRYLLHSVVLCINVFHLQLVNVVVLDHRNLGLIHHRFGLRLISFGQLPLKILIPKLSKEKLEILERTVEHYGHVDGYIY